MKDNPVESLIKPKETKSMWMWSYRQATYYIWVFIFVFFIFVISDFVDGNVDRRYYLVLGLLLAGQLCAVGLFRKLSK